MTRDDRAPEADKIEESPKDKSTISTESRSTLRAIFRDGLFGLAFLYVLLVGAMALSVLVAFWAKAWGFLPALDWPSLLGLAVGTGGLGAGTLVFRPIIDKVIER